MNKMVSGEEEEMGTLEGVFDPKAKILSLTPKENIRWSFQLEARELKGTLYYNGVLYRIARIEKTN